MPTKSREKVTTQVPSPKISWDISGTNWDEIAHRLSRQGLLHRIEHLYSFAKINIFGRLGKGIGRFFKRVCTRKRQNKIGGRIFTKIERCHIGMQYSLFCVAIWAILERKRGTFRGQKSLYYKALII